MTFSSTLLPTPPVMSLITGSCAHPGPCVGFLEKFAHAVCIYIDSLALAEAEGLEVLNGGSRYVPNTKGISLEW
jgi:hypothetical protein